MSSILAGMARKRTLTVANYNYVGEELWNIDLYSALMANEQRWVYILARLLWQLTGLNFNSIMQRTI
jgi:hypothetical protein